MFAVNNSLMVITSLVAADHPVAVVDRLFQWEGIINIAIMVNSKALLCPAFQYFLDGHVCEPTEIAASNNMSSARRDHDYYNRESHLRRGIAEKRTIHFIKKLKQAEHCL